MPQLCLAVPSCPVAARRLRRALVLVGSGFALTAASASAATGGGAEAGDPAVAPASARTATAAAPAKASRAVVRSVQRKLHLEADGVYGTRTRAAIRRFQRRHHLAPDGRLGPGTLAALGVRARAASAAPAPAASGHASQLLEAIARCESGGDPTRVSANGQHRGKYQFLVSTWESVGGTGDPAAAPEAEQDQRAAKLLAAQGTKPWPVCGKKAQSA